MRFGLSILFLLAGFARCHAQQQEQGILDRIDSSRNRAMAAMNRGAKRDPSLGSALQNKKFNGGSGIVLDKKAAGPQSFRYDQKFSASHYNATRNFFGLKNPWFGKKVFAADEANLWSKSAMPNAEKKYRVENARVKEFYQAGKKAATTRDPVETKPFLGKGSAEGAVAQMKKDLTIDDVREILNKNH